MSDFLYKVSEPREDLTFVPSRFWRTEDWTSSSTRIREGHIEDTLLYAAEFDEVNIHLLPKVWRLRVWVDGHNVERLRRLNLDWRPGCRALIFCRAQDREAIGTFRPTIFRFAREGFEPVPSNEFVSRSPQTAVGAETIGMLEALERWRVELRYVEDRDEITSLLRGEDISFSVQT